MISESPQGDAMRDVKQWSRNLQLEVDGATVYTSMARNESEETVAALYERLAAMESRHARIWGRKLRAAGAWRGMPRPSWTATLLTAVASRFGPDIVARSLAARESAERAAYDAQDDEISAALSSEERFHGWVLGRITRAKLSGTGMARLGNALRAAVLGMNDGLVANLSLLMGVAGAGGDAHALVVAGLAGLLAGSLSMALGEYLSVQTSRELYERQLVVEREAAREIASPFEADAVALIFVSRGMSTESARVTAQNFIAGALVSGVERAKEGDALGDLGGSAWIASLTSWAMFATGAAVPLVAFAFFTGTLAAIVAILLTGAALFANGSIVTLITGRPPVSAGLRQVGVGFAAAAVTYTLGRLFNVAFA